MNKASECGECGCEMSDHASMCSLWRPSAAMRRESARIAKRDAAGLSPLAAKPQARRGYFEPTYDAYAAAIAAQDEMS